MSCTMMAILNHESVAENDIKLPSDCSEKLFSFLQRNSRVDIQYGQHGRNTRSWDKPSI